jgi:hypothetical protein
VGVEIPAKVRRAIGLHEASSWGRPGVFSCGFIPPGRFAQLKPSSRNGPDRGAMRMSDFQSCCLHIGLSEVIPLE